jgi:hypothetical protein
MVAQPTKRFPTALAIAGVGIGVLVLLSVTDKLDPIRQIVESNGYRTTERSYLGLVPHQQTKAVPGLEVQAGIFDAIAASKIRNLPGVTADAKYGMALHIKRGNGDDYYMISDKLTMAPAEAVKFYRSQIKETRFDEGHSTFQGKPCDTWYLTGICPDGKTEFTLKIIQAYLGSKEYRFDLEFTRPR